MKHVWTVELVKTPTINDFKAGYFPRQFAYKKDAAALVEEVKHKGGEAIIKRGACPFQVGSRVKLREDVLQRHSRSVPCHAGYTTEEFAWRDTLRKLAGVSGIVARVFDGKHVNVDFAGVCIGIDYTELEAYTPLFIT